MCLLMLGTRSGQDSHRALMFVGNPAVISVNVPPPPWSYALQIVFSLNLLRLWKEKKPIFNWILPLIFYFIFIP